MTQKTTPIEYGVPTVIRATDHDHTDPAKNAKDYDPPTWVTKDGRPLTQGLYYGVVVERREVTFLAMREPDKRERTIWTFVTKGFGTEAEAWEALDE